MRFVIHDDAVRRQAGNLGVTVEGLQEALQRYITAAGSLPGVWVGPGAENFQAFDKRFQATSQGLVGSLRTIQAEVNAVTTSPWTRITSGPSRPRSGTTCTRSRRT